MQIILWISWSARKLGQACNYAIKTLSKVLRITVVGYKTRTLFFLSLPLPLFPFASFKSIHRFCISSACALRMMSVIKYVRWTLLGNKNLRRYKSVKCPRVRRLTQLPRGFKNITFIVSDWQFPLCFTTRKVAEPKALVESSLRLHQSEKARLISRWVER